MLSGNHAERSRSITGIPVRNFIFSETNLRKILDSTSHCCIISLLSCILFLVIQLYNKASGCSIPFGKDQPLFCSLQGSYCDSPNSRNRILRNGMMTKRTESPRLCSRKAHGFRPAGNACQPEPSSPARTAYSVWRSASAVLGIAFFGTGTAL